MRKSAGILLFRKKAHGHEVLLVHPGGPYWKGREAGAWTIPKGEFTDPEDPLHAAVREFEEETGHKVHGPFIPLNPVKQKGGKLVYAWAAEGDMDAAAIVSNTYRLEWPYKSGRWLSFPEVDKAGWFRPPEAKERINEAQRVWIDEVLNL
ncbi:MAG TPA: NUDIX domain-containing protein [Flavisolibacter sp.]|nr:NUDIX domain-containing protein [Flavisolibacter sp.]